MQRYLLPKLSCFLLGISLLAASCSKTIDKDPNSGGGGTGSGGSDEDISLTIPVAHTGDVPNNPDPDPEPKVSEEYAPYVGVWKQTYGDNTFAFLPDGRVAFYKMNNGKTEKYVGVY